MPAGTADVRCCGFTRSRVPVTGPRGRTALPSDRASIPFPPSGARRGLAVPAELRPVHPEAVEHDRELPGERHLGPLQARPRVRATRSAQAFSAENRRTRRSITCAASNGAVRTWASPALLMCLGVAGLADVAG